MDDARQDGPPAADGRQALDRLVARHRFDRLVMLCDGVFAIAITLAALEIRVPEQLSDAAAIWAAAQLQLVNYMVSFAVIASFWIGNRDLFARVAHVDAVLTALVLATLCAVALVPAATHVIYAQRPGAGTVRAYALVMVAAGATNLAAWAYAARPNGPMLAHVSARYRWQRLSRVALVPALFATVLVAPGRGGVAAAAVLLVAFLLARRVVPRIVAGAHKAA